MYPERYEPRLLCHEFGAFPPACEEGVDLVRGKLEDIDEDDRLTHCTSVRPASQCVNETDNNG
ncbi:Uncharacterised protein [Mycobacteroides abscessus subsp. abscessus]|nr:Uncharacterised protein [Mycobacteroides abscessus subsp. abscessus]